MNKNEIKRVDYLDFISEDSARRERFISDFGDSFSNMGFAIVANHGITSDIKQQLYKSAEQFFSLSDDQKKQYEDERNFGQRGYISKNKETAKGKTIPDLKEFYHIGQELDQKTLDLFNYPSNIWPEEFPALKTIALDVFNSFQKTGKNLLKAIALYLNLDENYFSDKVNNGNSILRLLHYYPLTEEMQKLSGAVRAAAHGDINLITLLMGANVDGLQAQTLDHQWIDVMPEDDEIVINVGNMLARLSNDVLRSTIHRVINPKDKSNLGKSRYSSPFFLHPHPKMDLSCLPSCISDSNPKHYPNITAGAFLAERLVQLGLKTEIE